MRTATLAGCLLLAPVAAARQDGELQPIKGPRFRRRPSSSVSPCGPRSRVASGRDGRWLLVLDARTGTTRAFDLEADPQELHPLCPVPKEAGPLEEQLRLFAAREREREAPAELDPDTLERLRALGYLRK